MMPATWARRVVSLMLPVLLVAPLTAQRAFTRVDSLRGGLDTPGRSWWDVTFYDLELAVNSTDSTISGRNVITYQVVGTGSQLQIDLMAPLRLDSVVQDGRRLNVRTDGNAHFATVSNPQAYGSVNQVTAWFSGRPVIR